MNNYTYEFPNHDNTHNGKDGQDITLEQALSKQTYISLGWPFEYSEAGIWKYHWVITEGNYPTLIRVSPIAVFPNMSDLPNSKDGQSMSPTDLLSKETYEDAGWDFDTIWEMPEHDKDEGIFYLPSLRGLETTLMPEKLIGLFAVVFRVTHKFNDETLLLQIIIITQTGVVTLRAARLKGYEAYEKEKQVTVDELGKTINVEFNYYVKLPYLSSEDSEELSLIIASAYKHRDRYKFRERLLSGQYVIQTIDQGRDIWHIRFYATEEQKLRLDAYFAGNEAIEYIKNLKTTKLKIKELNWGPFAGGSPSERVYLGEMEAVEVSS